MNLLSMKLYIDLILRRFFSLCLRLSTEISIAAVHFWLGPALKWRSRTRLERHKRITTANATYISDIAYSIRRQTAQLSPICSKSRARFGSGKGQAN